MNRILIIFSLAALVILGSCKKDETTRSTPGNIKVTILVNKNATGGTVSGTIDGKAVNYSF